MACSINLFQQPQLVDSARHLVQDLQDQIQLTEAFDRAKSRLEACSQLTSNDLQKCDVFVAAVNEASDAGHILHELSLMTLDELTFVSIYFREQRIKKLLPLLTSSKVRDYTQTRQIPNPQRREILVRLSRLAGERKGRFEAIIKPMLRATQNIAPRKRQSGSPLRLASQLGRGADIKEFRERFSPTIVEVVDNSELRKWEIDM
ncbi:hypothetical protein CSOJ01_02832 [Colletotrichum sojae]|uniref:Uncharacterized protein n=1 Tax=Colletotrichum sojae TaxID=2175907 RepID=A0A8H6JNZ9_9PEZI|nr:hypothetical protein CSOJ01_02832 [Colletotrichum sojae]